MRSAAAAALIYAAVSSAYILLSDHLLGRHAADIAVVTQVAMLKGWAFILVTGWLIFFLLRREIRKYAAAEKNLAESESRLQTFAAATFEGIVFSEAGRVVDCNDQFARMLGYSRDELLGSPLSDLIADDARAHVSENFALNREDVLAHEMIRKDGSRISVEAHGRPVELGNLRTRCTAVRDVTGRRRMEAALIESEAKYRRMFETTSEAIMAVDDQKRVTLVNRRMADMLGYAIEEMVGRPGDSFFFEEDLPDHAAKLAARRRGVNEVYERRFRRKDGQAVWALVSATPILDAEGRFRGAFGMSTDITARKQAEEDLSVFRQMVASAQDAMCLVGRDYAYRIANQAYLQEVGLKPDTIMGKTVADVLGKPLFENVIQARLDRCLAGEAVSYSDWFDYPAQSRRYMQITLSPCRNRASEVVGAMVVARDLTELQTAQKELKRLAAAIEQAAETVVVTDAAGAIQYVNPAFEQETGYRREEAIGKNPSILKSGKHDDAFYRDMWNTLVSGGTWQGHLVNKRKDGRLYTEKAKISPVRDASGAISNYVAVKHDITKELELEQNYREAQKMQAVGTLAAGIAHDFNNVLGLIVGNAEMLQLKGAVTGPAAESVKQILSASMRAKNTVKQILMLSRRGRMERIPISLRPLIKETAEFLRSSLSSNIQLVVDLDADAGTVSADPGQMQQVLINLCTNAAQAMEDDGGTLTIRLTNTALSQEAIQFPGHSAGGDFVEIIVSDTGAGIEPTVRERIFEPFFTTREIGKGQGLGLSVVHGIVASHGGSIKVDSKAGKGATFHVFLPRIPSEPKPESTPLGLLPKGRERILFIDDEKALARVGEMTLRHLGYQVNTQNSPVAALDVFRSSPGEFDLVITDLTMPQMSGVKLAAELLRIRPGLPVILCTGNTEKINPHEAGLLGIREILTKPVTIQDLANSVRNALDGSDTIERALPPFSFEGDEKRN